MSKVVHQQLQQMADNGEGRIVEDNDDAITYIQVLFWNPASFFYLWLQLIRCYEMYFVCF